MTSCWYDFKKPAAAEWQAKSCILQSGLGVSVSSLRVLSFRHQFTTVCRRHVLHKLSGWWQLDLFHWRVQQRFALMMQSKKFADFSCAVFPPWIDCIYCAALIVDDLILHMDEWLRLNLPWVIRINKKFTKVAKLIVIRCSRNITNFIRISGHDDIRSNRFGFDMPLMTRTAIETEL